MWKCALQTRELDDGTHGVPSAFVRFTAATAAIHSLLFRLWFRSHGKRKKRTPLPPLALFLQFVTPHPWVILRSAVTAVTPLETRCHCYTQVASQPRLQRTLFGNRGTTADYADYGDYGNYGAKLVAHTQTAQLLHESRRQGRTMVAEEPQENLSCGLA